mmetsp:Transcript_2972/g.6899  ORF Transcript_2972/g.6899 Transcript_2972/m.6899 type:complete len:271 (-) Transcript_2972:147-959(-)
MKKGRTRSEADHCSICCLPLPLDADGSTLFKACCMNILCNGCTLAAANFGMEDCPFCRVPTPDESQALVMIKKLADAGDPLAVYNLGTKYEYGEYGLEKDVTRAVELYERAAELGVKEAHYNIGVLYDEGTDVEKDVAKAIRHYESAAMGGDVSARYNLGSEEHNSGNYDLALQHFLISAKMGDEDSLGMIKAAFMDGLASKADYATALRGYRESIDEMSSPDRDKAKSLGFEEILRTAAHNRELVEKTTASRVAREAAALSAALSKHHR